MPIGASSALAGFSNLVMALAFFIGVLKVEPRLNIAPLFKPSLALGGF
jgi:hypothetical protein